MNVRIPTQWYKGRVNVEDITRENLNAQLLQIPFIDSVIACSEIGKRRYRHHYHVLLSFTEPVLMQPADWRFWLGRSARFVARNPNSAQPLIEYVDKGVEYIQKDGDWWEFTREEH